MIMMGILEGASAAGDHEIDFRFLKFGQARRAVVEMMGTPDSETRTETLSLRRHRLIWLDDDGRRYVASFLNNRLFYWKTCTPGARGCD
jgi:hypothetical protein